MTTDNCTLCSPLYAKGAIFSWSDVVNLFASASEHNTDVMCVIISLQTIYTQYFVDTLQRMAHPCIIQTQQPTILVEITTESLFLGLKCTFHQHIVANRRHRLLIKCSPTS